MAEIRYLGIGLYTIPETARLLRVPVGKLRRWAQGYRFADGRFSKPMFGRDYPELADQGILTFQDLIELCLVSQFRQAGVSMQTIRTTARWAAEQFETNHPFAVRRFHTDGKRLFAEMELSAEKGVPQRVYQELPTCQYVLDDIAESFFLKLDYEADQVRHYWPLGKQCTVVLDPARSFGEPIDVTSGVPTRLLYEMHRARKSVAEVANWFQVEPEAVRAAIEYEQWLARVA
jgi:uncharacterized protein (DUF433 family)